MLLTCRSYKSLLHLSVALLLWFGSVVPAAAGDPFGFTGNWDYRNSGGDGGGRSQFNESYNLTYSKELTAAMTVSGSARYSENKVSDGQGSSSFSPSLSLDMRNDLFSLNLNASETKNERQGSAAMTSNSYGLNLNSQIDNWPSVRFYFNQAMSTDDDVPKKIDSDSTSFGGSVEYAFEYVDLVYDVRNSLSTDNNEASESESLDQTFQVGYDQSFWQGRVSVSASQQYQKTEGTTERRVGIGNEYFLDVPALVGLFGVDNSPITGELADKADLVDGNLTTSTGIDIFSTSNMQNMGVWVNQRPVTRLRVVLVDNQLTTIASSQQNSVTWSVYSSPDNNAASIWTPVALVPFVPTDHYIEESGRTVVLLDFVSSVAQQYLKVVTDALPALVPIFVSELEAEEKRIATADLVVDSRITESLQTQFSTSVRLTDRWTLSYSLRRAETLQESGDTLQFSHSLNSSYLVSEKLGFSFGISENTEESDSSADRRNRSYSLSMSASPLPTLNISLGYTHSEADSANGQGTVSDSISSSINANIYPDLSASLSTNWSQSENLDEGTETSSYGVNLNATAYFTPKVDMTSNVSYTESDSSSGTTSRSTGYTFTLGYRPSDILLFNFSYDGQVENSDSAFSANSSWLWSKKLQSQFGIYYTMGDKASQQYNGVLSWLINRSLSFQASANFLTADEGDSWNSNASLNMIF